MTWYVVVNDLIGGWAVSDVDKPLSQINYREREGYLIAECITEADARRIARLLNEDDGS